VVPVKAFSQAKMRLAGVLGPGERSELARQMAATVVSAAHPLPVFVVCDDPEVADWAVAQRASPMLSPGLGLNGAVNAAFSQLGDDGWGQIVVAHGDLPLATNLRWLADAPGIVLVPDRREDGTNVISLPTGCGFRFSYGPGSFARHQHEAQRTGVPWWALRDHDLAWDIDVPADLAGVGARKAKR
jgi:2-phospho-L-lactate guanylyltransferase